MTYSDEKRAKLILDEIEKIKRLASVAENITEYANEIVNLRESQDWLSCLESAGVDNWSGIDFAYELGNEMEN
jgi:hypothetical protein